jgi:hypothetical protein
MYFGSFASFVALQWWPALRHRSAGLGLLILALGLVTSSFASRVWQLVLTQGALYAIGGILLYSSVCLLVDEWFVRKKGIAFGVMWTGTGFSGISVPYTSSRGACHVSLFAPCFELGRWRWLSCVRRFSITSNLAFRYLKHRR